MFNPILFDTNALYKEQKMMITNIFDQIGLIRRFKGGEWVKTNKRGWIDMDTYAEYLSFNFDPEATEYVVYKNFLIIEQSKESDE